MRPKIIDEIQSMTLYSNMKMDYNINLIEDIAVCNEEQNEYAKHTKRAILLVSKTKSVCVHVL